MPKGLNGLTRIHLEMYAHSRHGSVAMLVSFDYATLDELAHLVDLFFTVGPNAHPQISYEDEPSDFPQGETSYEQGEIRYELGIDFWNEEDGNQARLLLPYIPNLDPYFLDDLEDAASVPPGAPGWLDRWSREGDDMPCPKCGQTQLKTLDGQILCYGCGWDRGKSISQVGLNRSVVKTTRGRHVCRPLAF